MKKVIKPIIFIIILVLIFQGVYSAASSYEVASTAVGTVKTIFIAAVVLVLFYLVEKYGGDD